MTKYPLWNEGAKVPCDFVIKPGLGARFSCGRETVFNNDGKNLCKRHFKSFLRLKIRKALEKARRREQSSSS